MSWDETPEHLLPVPTPDDAEFWRGAHRGELRVQRCGTCGLHQHYARLRCSHCGADDLAWITASGEGTVYSFTVIRRHGAPPFKARVPFVVAAVDLAEAGARVLAVMPEVTPEQVHVGMKVRATFRPAGDEVGFVDFTAA